MEHFRPGNDSEFEKIRTLAELPLHKRPGTEKNEVLNETFAFFKEFLTQNGFTEYQDGSQAYRKLPDQKMVVRREDPRNIFALFQDSNGYTVGFENERYANCVEWNPQTDGARNIYNAFMEGFTNMNGIVTVVGFHADQQNDLIAMGDSIKNFYGLDRSGVRSYQGGVTTEALEFITIRVPGHLLAEEYLTEDEIDKIDEYQDALDRGEKPNPVMIFRTYLPPHSTTPIENNTSPTN